MADTNFESQWLECQQKYGKDVEVDIDEITEVTDQVTLPGIERDSTGVFTRYIIAPMTLFAQYARNAATAIQNTWNAWFGTDATSGVQKQWADLSADAVEKTTAANEAAGRANEAAQNTETAITNANNAAANANEKATAANTAAGSANTAAGTANTAAQNANDKAALANTAAGNANTATTNAKNAASAANTAAGRVDAAISEAEAATDGAENVNAQLSGMTVTITNREGTSSSVNIGFEIYNTYPSVAAMNADAANVPTGKFVMIATTDPTSADNAKLYGKNAQGGFTFLSDLDQASSAAWADWLNNMKPTIEADHTQAGQDHTQAQSDHTRAESDHTRAESDHTSASGDHTRAETDHNTATSDHQQATSDTGRASTDHSTATSDHTQAGNDHSVATGDHTTAQGDHTQAGNDHTRAESDHSTATQDHTQAGTDHTRAESDHTKVAGAENLNATLVGFTVSITNRQGITTSVDIGFEIYRTYTSVSAMNADAANVPQGKFVVIATTDATDPDNAKMYCRNSQPATATTPFQFLCDLDQASSSAWADWLNNQKPLIIQATADANDAAALANTKAQLADDKATLANTKAQYAEEQGDRAKAYNDHPWEIGNDGYIYVWDETTEQMVRTNKLIISFDDLTDAQIQAMIDLFFQTLVFDDTPTQDSDNVVKSGGIWTALQLKMDKSNVATVQTCEDIIDELI